MPVTSKVTLFYVFNAQSIATDLSIVTRSNQYTIEFVGENTNKVELCQPISDLPLGSKLETHAEKPKPKSKKRDDTGEYETEEEESDDDESSGVSEGDEAVTAVTGPGATAPKRYRGTLGGRRPGKPKTFVKSTDLVDIFSTSAKMLGADKSFEQLKQLFPGHNPDQP